MECPRCAAIRQRQNERFRERLKSDPEFKQKVLQQSRDCYARNAERQRAASYKRAVLKGLCKPNPKLLERYSIELPAPPAEPPANPADPTP